MCKTSVCTRSRLKPQKRSFLRVKRAVGNWENDVCFQRDKRINLDRQVCVNLAATSYVGSHDYYEVRQSMARKFRNSFNCNCRAIVLYRIIWKGCHATFLCHRDNFLMIRFIKINTCDYQRHKTNDDENFRTCLRSLFAKYLQKYSCF